MKPRIPAQGSPEDMMDRIRAFIQPVDPALTPAFRGANDSLIQRYAELAGFGSLERLPPGYLGYLRTCGMADGRIFSEVDTTLTRILDLYDADREDEKQLGEERELLPDLPLCGVYTITGQIAFDLREDAPIPGAVISVEWGYVAPKETREAYAVDWERYLMPTFVRRHAEASFAQRSKFSRCPADVRRALGSPCDMQVRRMLDEIGDRYQGHRISSRPSAKHAFPDLVCPRGLLAFRCDPAG